MEIKTTASNIDSAYADAIHDILVFGQLAKYSKGYAYEVYNLTFDIYMHKSDFVIFHTRDLAYEKLRDELRLYLNGISDVSEYNNLGIKWWDYAKPKIYNSYPKYMKNILSIPFKESRNNVIYLGKTNEPSAQRPCISQINIQIRNKELTLIITMRSGDMSLGVPSDMYQMSILGNLIAEGRGLYFSRMIFNINNAHIYSNNMSESAKWVSNIKKDSNKIEKYNFKLNV